MPAKFIKTITITNIGRGTIQIAIAPTSRSNPIFDRSGTINIVPGDSITVELERVNISHIENLKSLGVIKRKTKNVSISIPEPEPEPEPEAQTATISFTVDTAALPGGPPTYSVSITLVTSDGLVLESEVTADVNDTGGTAIEATNYSFIGPKQVVFSVGSASGSTQTVDFDQVGQNAPKTTTVELTLSNASGATIVAPSVFTLTEVGAIGGGGGES